MTVMRSLLAFLVVCLTPLLALEADFADPAPPVGARLKETDAPAAKPTPELTFYAAPRPLAKGATTANSPGFLGPNHSTISPETKLKYDLTNRPLVGEYQKGTGCAAPAVVGDRLFVFPRVGDEEIVD